MRVYASAITMITKSIALYACLCERDNNDNKKHRRLTDGKYCPQKLPPIYGAKTCHSFYYRTSIICWQNKRFPVKLRQILSRARQSVNRKNLDIEFSRVEGKCFHMIWCERERKYCIRRLDLVDAKLAQFLFWKRE